MRIIALGVSNGVTWVVLCSTFIDIWLIEHDIIVTFLPPVKYVIFSLRVSTPKVYESDSMLRIVSMLCHFFLTRAPTGNHGAGEEWVDRNPLKVFLVVGHESHFILYNNIS